MKPSKDLKDHIKIQLVLPKDYGDISYYEKRLILALLTEVDSIIIPPNKKIISLVETCKREAEVLKQKFSLSIKKLPLIKIGLGALDPFVEEFSFFNEYSNNLENFKIEDFKNSILQSKEEGIEGVRFHAGKISTEYFMEIWEYISEIFESDSISLSVDRYDNSNAHLRNLIKKAYLVNSSIIIEVDGVSSSGGDNYYDTIQTLATADIIFKDFLVKERRKYKNTSIYLSGDINSKTKALANLTGIEYQGISFGTFYNHLSEFNTENITFVHNLLNDKSSLLRAIKNIKSIYKLPNIRQFN